MAMNTHGNQERQQLAVAYDRYAGTLYRYALLIAADPALAEDSVQQAFTKLAAMGARIEAVASLEHYLRTSVRNECYRLLKIPRATPSDTDAPALLEPVDAALDAQDQRRAIESALRQLPPEQREIVHLKIYESLTFQQIADLLAISLHTATSRYRYATEKLRDSLASLQQNKD